MGTDKPQDPSTRDDIDLEDLQGPKIDRRTTMKLISGAAIAGLAGCLGGSSDESGDGGSDDAGSDDGNSDGTGSDDGGSGDGDSNNSDSSSKLSGGSIQVGWFQADIANLDPHYQTTGEKFQLLANISSGLTMVTPDIELQGDLARDWTVEKNGARIIYDLREDVTFHNGDEFTAEDVAFSIERSVTEETPNSDLISPLKPLDDGGVEVIDDYTVQVEFEDPFVPGMIYLSREGRAANIINQRALEEMGVEEFQLQPVSTGPYKVVSHDVSDSIQLEAFDDYYRTDDNGEQLPYLDSIEVKPIAEPGTIINALQAGDLDFINQVPLQNVSRVENASNLTVQSRPDLNFYMLSLNSDVEPFGSETVRLGISKLIDSEEIVENAFFGHANAEPVLFTPALDWVYRDWEDKPHDQAYDPEAGMELLEEAGAENASFTLLADDTTRRVMEIIQRQLSNQGLDVDINQVSPSVYWERVPDADAVLTWSSGDYDPDVGIYRNFHSEGAWNDSGFDNSRIDELLEEQRKTVDQDERVEMLHEIEDTVIKKAPGVFMMHREDVVGHGDHLEGFVHVPFQRRLESLYLSE